MTTPISTTPITVPASARLSEPPPLELELSLSVIVTNAFTLFLEAYLRVQEGDESEPFWPGSPQEAAYWVLIGANTWPLPEDIGIEEDLPSVDFDTGLDAQFEFTLKVPIKIVDRGAFTAAFNMPPDSDDAFLADVLATNVAREAALSKDTGLLVAHAAAVAKA